VGLYQFLFMEVPGLPGIHLLVGRHDKLYKRVRAMNYLIDGHNLISKIPGLDLSMLDDEQRLIELLNRFGQGSRHRLEVYFDGAPAGQAGVRNYSKVRAHFVTVSSSADDAIRVRLAGLGRSAANWVVVSSDHSVQAAAREAHARVISAEDFAGRIQESMRTTKGEGGETKEQPLSEAEVNEWLRIFKGHERKN
jgi:predicted RNA-binding protein with PIN domain